MDYIINKKKGLETKKQIQIKKKRENIEQIKDHEIYKKIKDLFPDAELIDGEKIND